METCETFWRDWTAATKTDGPHAEAIKRSLITLKALTYMPSGGIVAAPTTSLPERFGGERNWDYRLCWLRDATLTLLAMMNAGIYNEAAAWRDWLQRAIAGSPDDMQIMYGLMGERRLKEWEVDWLPGYADSKPVPRRQRRPRTVPTRRLRRVDGCRRTVAQGRPRPARRWLGDATHPGQSCRENLGNARQRHLGDAWTAAAFRLFEGHGLGGSGSRHKGRREHDLEGSTEGPIDLWRSTRDKIHAEVCNKGFDAERNTFRAAYGSTQLDASLLLLAQTGFLAPDDPRFIGTVEAIEHDLLQNGFVMRYNTHGEDDGLKPGEGAFLACSFWLADAYISIGREKDADVLFDRLLAIRNDLGLLAEEYDSREKRQQG